MIFSIDAIIGRFNVYDIESVNLDGGEWSEGLFTAFLIFTMQCLASGYSLLHGSFLSLPG